MSNYQSLMDKSNNCLFYIRRIRAIMLKLHAKLTEIDHVSTSGEADWIQLLEQCAAETKLLEESYNGIEEFAYNLPDKLLPQMEMLTRIKTVFQEELVDLQGQKMIDSLINAENWNEGNFQFFSFASQFFRMGGYFSRKRPSVMSNIPPAVPCSFDANINNSLHACYEISMYTIQKEVMAKKIGIWPVLLEKSSFGSIFEVQFGQLVGETQNKERVITLKMLLVETQGVIESVMFIAPNEEWKYLEGFAGKTVDLTMQSRHLIYQKLTAHVNNNLHILIHPPTETRWNHHYLMATLATFGKYNLVFESECIICKKIMKDFLPCVMFDPRVKTAAYHESCR